MAGRDGHGFAHINASSLGSLVQRTGRYLRLFLSKKCLGVLAATVVVYVIVPRLMFPYVPWRQLFKEKNIGRLYSDVYYPQRALVKVSMNKTNFLSFVLSNPSISLMLLTAVDGNLSNAYHIADYYQWTGSERMCQYYETNHHMLYHMKSNGETCTTNLRAALTPHLLKESYAMNNVRNLVESGRKTVTYMASVTDALVTPTGKVIFNGTILSNSMCDKFLDAGIDTYKGYMSELIDSVFVISQFWGDGVFHFLSENMPRVVPFVSFLTANPDIKIHVVDSKLMQKLLPRLGLDVSRIVVGTVVARKVYLPESMFCGNPHPYHMQMLAHKLSLSSARANGPVFPDTVLLITRSQNINRHFSHAKSIQSLVKRLAGEFALNFYEFKDKPLPPLEEIEEQFNRAAVIVAPHGAGESNLMFARPGAFVIESVCNLEHLNLCYRHLAYILGLRYHAIPGNKGCERYINVEPEEIESPLRYYLSVVQKHAQDKKLDRLFREQRAVLNAKFDVEILGGSERDFYAILKDRRSWFEYLRD